MALVVEDGTGKADAESYVSVADATTYHANRGNAAWAGLASDTLREQLLRKATDFMVVYRERWTGERVKLSQALDWPRYNVPMRDAPGRYGPWPAYYPVDSVPPAVARACAELALRAIDGDLAEDLDPPVIEESIGPITTKYAVGARRSRTFQSVEALLSPLLDGSGTMVKVVRA